MVGMHFAYMERRERFHPANNKFMYKVDSVVDRMLCKVIFHFLRRGKNCTNPKISSTIPLYLKKWGKAVDFYGA